jgi:hypothetical protein
MEPYEKCPLGEREKQWVLQRRSAGVVVNTTASRIATKNK